MKRFTCCACTSKDDPCTLETKEIYNGLKPTKCHFDSKKEIKAEWVEITEEPPR